jgi:hypothetical protein
MANTYTLISNNVLSASAATVTFSAIPNTYTDLVLRWSAQAGGSSIYVTYNSDTSSSTNYSYTLIRGDGSAVDSFRETGTYYQWIGAQPTTGSVFSNGELYIPNYTSTGNKPASAYVVRESNTTTISNGIMETATLYKGTSAISGITFTTLGGGNFVSGSSFYLYGIKNS